MNKNRKMSYRKPSSNKPDYDFDRLEKYLNSQEEYLKSHTRNSNIEYKPYLSPTVKKEKRKLEKGSDYSKRVDKLISLTVEYPRADEIKDPDINLFTYKGFDIPEATHRREKYDKKGEYEVWSKDIDKANRFIYRIYDGLKIIYVISIEEHDLNEAKKSTKLQSDIDSLNYLLDPYNQREDFNYIRQKN